jgi:hypothetical protein
MFWRMLRTTAIGAVGAAVFVFLFPKGSLTTFMHQVLQLPGPGAGIALIVGPFALILALVGYRVGGEWVGALPEVLLAFSAVVAILVALVAPMNPKGGFGTGWFILACLAGGVGAGSALFFGKELKILWRLLLAGVAGNLVLLVFYWLVIFPMTTGWVEWGDVPVLLLVCVAGGMLAGLIAWLVSPALLHYIDRHKEEDHVRAR